MSNIYVLVDKLDGETIYLDSAYSKKEEAYKAFKKIFKEKILEYESEYPTDIVFKLNSLLKKKITDEVYDEICKIYNEYMSGNNTRFNLENTLYITETKLNPQNEMRNFKNRMKNLIK